MYKQRKFFYAHTDANVYDELVNRTQRDFNESHRVLVELIQFLISELPKRSRNYVLDLGCGTGVEAINLLNEIPGINIIAVDNSEEMLSVFRRKLNDFPCADNNGVDFFQMDILDEEEWEDVIIPKLSSCHCPIIVSAYTLHHFGIEDKKKLYRRIWENLPEKGVFINLDLFSYSNDNLADFAQKNVEDWILSCFNGNPNAGTDSQKIQDIGRQWLTHVKYDNKPLPIYPISTKGENLNSEFSLLCEAGFSIVEVPYRNLQSGIVMAKK